jgi:hypothetical protein
MKFIFTFLFSAFQLFSVSAFASAKVSWNPLPPIDAGDTVSLAYGTTTNALTNVVSKLTGTNYTLAGLKTNTIYYAKIRADSTNGISSMWTAIIKFTNAAPAKTRWFFVKTNSTFLAVTMVATNLASTNLNTTQIYGTNLAEFFQAQIDSTGSNVTMFSTLSLTPKIVWKPIYSFAITNSVPATQSPKAAAAGQTFYIAMAAVAATSKNLPAVHIYQIWTVIGSNLITSPIVAQPAASVLPSINLIP